MTAYVTLNVGGKQYLTERLTLESYPKSLFQSLLKGNGIFSKNKEGHYLVNRDGEIFRHVLNFMRCKRLVLPDGFNEYDLLQYEAEFFKLGELKKAIQARIQEETGGAIGLRVGGKTFRMTTEEASKEQDSFFANMLSGQISVPRDSLGNFVIDRDASMFRLVLHYLKDGGIFLNIPSKKLDSLKKEGEYFELKMLAQHIESVQFMQRLAGNVPLETPFLNLHLFCHDTYHCVVYANVAKAAGWFSDWHISEICSKCVIFSDGTLAGLLDVKKVQGNGRPVNNGDIILFIRKKMGAKQEKVMQLKDNWTKTTFSNLNC